MMVQTTDLLTKLVQRTKDGKAEWNISSNPEMYPADVAGLSMFIGDDSFSSQVTFRVFDASGDGLDSVDRNTEEGYWRLDLQELFRAARLSAKGASEKYAAALEALEGD